jgi:GTP-binding protein EngB required for normal cell division
MKKILILITIIFTSNFLVSCKTVSTKIDEKTAKEEKELSKWLNQSETELKIIFGKPDKIEFTNSRNRYYVYITEKLKIKCERKFEISPNNIVIGFSSKNCF